MTVGLHTTAFSDLFATVGDNTVQSPTQGSAVLDKNQDVVPIGGTGPGLQGYLAMLFTNAAGNLTGGDPANYFEVDVYYYLLNP